MIGDLRELAGLTSGPAGAERVAWTRQWMRAREWLEAKLGELPCDVQRDPAGNLVADLPGRANAFLAIGSHLDSVPGGGWLDGTLGVLSGLELFRAYAAQPDPPPVGLRLIDWADEEGARFGRSLFGSGVTTNLVNPKRCAELTDSDGVSLAQAMRECGLEIEQAAGAPRSLHGVFAYLELHIEQGPVLERAGKQLAVVTGTVGVERRMLHLEGEAAHAGAAPMEMRRDPVVAAARIITKIVELAGLVGGTATFGYIRAQPGVGTVVPERCEVVVDLRHPKARTLKQLLLDTDAVTTQIAAATGVQAGWEAQWCIAPIPFHAHLVETARQACADLGVDPLVMPSGALHDAAAVARLLPVAMLFTPSQRGISHSPAENTSDADLAVGVLALAALTARVLDWAAVRDPDRLAHLWQNEEADSAPQRT